MPLAAQLDDGRACGEIADVGALFERRAAQVHRPAMGTPPATAIAAALSATGARCALSSAARCASRSA